MAASGQQPPSVIQEQWSNTRDTIIKLYGELPPALQEIDAQIMTQADTTARGVAAAFKSLGIQTRRALQQNAVEALSHFQTIQQAGTATPQALLDAWLDVVGKIDQGRLQDAPARLPGVRGVR